MGTEEPATPSLLEELRADSKPLRHGCAVCLWIEAQTNPEEWDQAFQANDIAATAIHRAMQRRGFDNSKGPIHNHRQGKHRVA